MHEVEEDRLSHTWAVATRISAALRRSGIPLDALNVIVADGAVAGQEVPHFHVHLIPRTQGDGFGLQRPQRYGAMPDRSELEDSAARIRAALA